MQLHQQFIEMAKSAGATNAAVIPVNKITFRREFRDACVSNACGKYSRCWMCPPDVGDIDQMIAEAKKYEFAYVYQSVWPLEDSYDFEGMMAGGQAHNDIAQRLTLDLESILQHPLKLAAGACQVCEKCSRLDNEPCRNPDKAIPSLEAYGIAVSELATACNMKYINGQNTVTYFGAFLAHT